ncbi:uncharacterized protein EMH_0018540 [Eimeria mitis]|uniref:Uncharacterized protein n=1 Tax=Eimeria mitis TaxID=44415 RepID=U6K7T0_9EIME|nr:uncharacterized protein EMH_0018540 [Eimeria mitis]CDJ34065.1 hypothetical protein EMH_0018540 [Eimeria mitis]
MVESMKIDIDSLAYTLLNTRGIPPQEVDAAREMLDESERLRLQLRSAGLHTLSESLSSSSSGLRDALRRRTGRKPSRSASLPSMLSRMAIRGPPPAPKATQAPRHSTPSVSSLDPQQPRGAEGTASAEQLGARPKTTTGSSTLWSSLRRRGHGAVTEDSARPDPTSPGRRLPGIPESGSQVRHINVQEVLSLTASMNRWATKCRDSLKSLHSASAREASLDGIAAQGIVVYREATSVRMDPSVDRESSQSFADGLKLLKSLLNEVHRVLIDSWLATIAKSRSALTTARYNLQTSVKETVPGSPPRAGGPYIGDVCALRANVDAAKRTSESLSRLLGVRSSHQRLSDALQGLDSVLVIAEKELQSAISSAAQMWRTALEDAEEGRQLLHCKEVSPAATKGRCELQESQTIYSEIVRKTAFHPVFKRLADTRFLLEVLYRFTTEPLEPTPPPHRPQPAPFSTPYALRFHRRLVGGRRGNCIFCRLHDHAKRPHCTSVVLNELEIMRLLLPVVALVASGLQADALAPVEGDPPNLPVFPTGDAEGPSFYSHSPHPVSPHSRIHHRRSISALVLIVPIVAVVFLIYQCILHLKRRDDLFITVQSRRLAAGEQDPCNPHEGDEGGSDPSSSPAGGPSHARQLGALQLTPADTACLTSEEVMAIGDADRILRSSIRNIQGLESQVGTLTATAANLRSMLDASPGEGGPEAERRSELEKMLHGNSQQTEALRRELKDKKLHCNGMAWTEGQQSRSLLLRARFFRSGRLLTGRAAAALVARDVVLGVPSSDIFDEALKLALSTLVHRLLAEGSNCQGLLSGDTFPSDEDIQRAKAAHSDLRNVASQLQVVDAMYGTTGHLQPVRESAKSLGAALERFAEGPAQKPQARVSVTPYGGGQVTPGTAPSPEWAVIRAWEHRGRKRGIFSVLALVVVCQRPLSANLGPPAHAEGAK